MLDISSRDMARPVAENVPLRRLSEFFACVSSAKSARTTVLQLVARLIWNRLIRWIVASWEWKELR